MFDFLAYAIEIEWLIAWLPIGPLADQTSPVMNAGTVRFRHGDAFDVGTNSKSTKLPIHPSLGPHAAGKITISIDDDGFYLVAVHANAGISNHEQKALTVRPALRIPYMVIAAGPPPEGGYAPDGGEVRVTVHGVITTVNRPIDTALNLRFYG